MDVRNGVERIKAAVALDEIRAVSREYSAKSSGELAALYSGRVGALSANDLAVEYAENVRASIVNNTPRGRFLADDRVEAAIKTSAKRIFQSQGASDDLAKQLAGDFLYGDAKAPVNSLVSIQNCLWCEASRDFASSLRGDVKVIAVNANPHRVFGQVEIPTALQNPHVRSLGGVPVETLRVTYARHGVEGILTQVQAAYIKEATLAGLLPTPAVEPLVGVRRAPGARFAIKGLGAASTVATLYDGAASVREAAALRDQGNDTGAQSHIVGAVSRNVGGLGGVALGASAGAALTSETGPGALIGGAVGGIAGAVAGDKLAAWIDHQRIHQQTDGEGRRWQFDPGHPARGWTRTVTGELDAQATVDRGIPVYGRQVLTASPELADRLNYQASSRAVELALSAPPKAQDPYRLPSTPEDHRPGNVYEGDWQRDAWTGRWSRQVTDSHVGLSMQRFHVETASPGQAAALDRQAQGIVEKNLEATPAAMAANYQAAYEQFGWSRHGEMPAAVQEALRHPGRMVASDGLTYTRGDDAHWTAPGMLYGRNPAEGNVQHELEAAYRMQSATKVVVPSPGASPQGFEAVQAQAVTTPVAPARSPAQIEGDALIARYFAALQSGDDKGALAIAHAYTNTDAAKQLLAETMQGIADRQQALPGRDQPLFTQAMAHLERLGPEEVRYEDRADMERMAGVLAFEARRNGLDRIDSVAIDQNDQLVATKDTGNLWFSPSATIDPIHASMQPLGQSLQGLAEETELQAQQALQQELEQSQRQSMSRGMSL
jgi:hypothetical protein